MVNWSGAKSPEAESFWMPNNSSKFTSFCVFCKLAGQAPNVTNPPIPYPPLKLNLRNNIFQKCVNMSAQVHPLATPGGQLSSTDMTWRLCRISRQIVDHCPGLARYCLAGKCASQHTWSVANLPPSRTACLVRHCHFCLSLLKNPLSRILQTMTRV